jgi:DNA-binding response OmpR family regulator
VTRIVVVEDEPLLARALARGLTNTGFDVSLAHDGHDGYQLARQSEPDLLVLDLMLPSLSGIEVLRRLRSEGLSMPVLVMSAKDSKADTDSALEAGADDYLRKPFPFPVLVARCRTLLRRAAAPEPVEKNSATMVLDPPTRTARFGSVEMALTRREFDLLEYLMRNAGQPCSREAILADVWGWELHRDIQNVVEVYIGYLRRKLEHATCGVQLQTVGGGDYLVHAGK